MISLFIFIDENWGAKVGRIFLFTKTEVRSRISEGGMEDGGWI